MCGTLLFDKINAAFLSTTFHSLFYGKSV